jgi:hypothetical protein
VNLDFAKVRAEVALLRGREVLVAEKDDRTLCDLQLSQLSDQQKDEVRHAGARCHVSTLSFD